MKTQVKMKSISLWKNGLVFAALLAALLPVLAEAVPLFGKHCVTFNTRPLSDFLKAQGTLNDFFPPVKDYGGWADNPQTTFGLIDYAGLADKYIKEKTGRSLGTKVSGIITECGLANGKAQITATLITTKALGFAKSIAALADNNFVFLKTPTIFGSKAVTDLIYDPGASVVDGADAAVGPAVLLTTFTVVQKDSNDKFLLPDFLDVVNNPGSYAPVKLNFTSTTFGKCADGTKARLDVHEVAATNEKDELVFSVEKVKIVDAKGDDCGVNDTTGENQ